MSLFIYLFIYLLIYLFMCFERVDIQSRSKNMESFTKKHERFGKY